MCKIACLLWISFNFCFVAWAGPAKWTSGSDIIGATPQEAAQADASVRGSSLDFNGSCNAITALYYSCGFNWNANSANTLNPDAHPGQYAGQLQYVAFCSNQINVYIYNGVAWCDDANIQISLTSPTESKPSDTVGANDITLSANVASGTTPKSGVTVSFTADVTPNSGGHDHHSVARPKGTLSIAQGTTDANGQIQFTFKASEVAGIHTIKATCTTCSNSPATKEVQVKVPGLLPISPNPPLAVDGTYAYALTSVDKTHQGNGRYHANQYPESVTSSSSNRCQPEYLSYLRNIS